MVKIQFFLSSVIQNKMNVTHLVGYRPGGGVVMGRYSSYDIKTELPYTFPSIIFFDQVVKDGKSVFTFEKWPRSSGRAEIKSKKKKIGHFGFQLCN